MENLKEREYLEDLGVDERIILKYILKKWIWGWGLDSSGSGQGPVLGYCEFGNEPLDSIERRRISWPNEWPLASQEGFWFMDVVTAIYSPQITCGTPWEDSRTVRQKLGNRLLSKHLARWDGLLRLRVKEERLTINKRFLHPLTAEKVTMKFFQHAVLSPWESGL
jgi:hypothetical protein